MRSDDDALIAWFSEDSAVQYLQAPPEQQLSQGAPACVTYGECVPRSENYEVTFAVDGTEAHVAPGERAEVSSFTAFNHHLQAGEPAGECADATGHFASAALFRRPIP